MKSSYSIDHFHHKYKASLLCLLLILIALFATSSCNRSAATDEKEQNRSIVYTMINVCDETRQADAHVLRFTNGSVFVIDTGRQEVNNNLAAFLKKNNIRAVDTLFISHFHKDHYGGIWEVIKAGIKIKTAYINMPDKEACDREKPWGCDYDDIIKTLEYMKKQGITVKNIRTGDVFFPQNDAVLFVLAAFDGNNTPVGKTDINDTSMIMKLVYGNESVLFPGDLNVSLGNYFVKHHFNVQADILKVPHHGTEGVASNDFFDSVSPKLALVPTPKALWLSDRSKRIRDYFSSKNIPVLVSGIKGDVTINLYKDKYDIVEFRGEGTGGQGLRNH